MTGMSEYQIHVPGGPTPATIAAAACVTSLVIALELGVDQDIDAGHVAAVWRAAGGLLRSHPPRCCWSARAACTAWRQQPPIPGFIADICMGARQPKMQPKLVRGRDAIVQRS